uniref:Uncharacterized protein n=1 Tax=Arundo donax TaxID=35708 RepID=A0A0A9F022_ARUDO
MGERNIISLNVPFYTTLSVHRKQMQLGVVYPLAFLYL